MLQATDIVSEIADALDLQAVALADGDYERLGELADRIAGLNDELTHAVAGLDAAGQAAVAGQLRLVVERAGQLQQEAETLREETRQELRGLQAGQSATAAYRQALPREATLNYSRQG